MKTSSNFLFMSLLMILINFTTYAQQNYYVSDSNGNNNNDGSETRPFKTIQKAADQTVNKHGVTVYIMPGTYNNPYYASINAADHILFIKPNMSGIQGQPNIYKAYDENNIPILKMNVYGSGRNTTQGWNAINIEGASYITIYHLKIIGGNDDLNIAKGEELYNFYQANKELKDINGNVTRPNNIRNSDWDYVTTTNTSGIVIIHAKANGWNYSTSVKNNYENGQMITPHHIIIDGCEIAKFPGSGISSYYGDYITIEWNTVYDTSWYTFWASSGISVSQGVNFDNNTGFKTIVRNNIVYGNKTQVKWVDSNNGRGDLYSDGNGIIADLNQLGIPNDGLSCVETYNGKTLFLNNISYNNGGSGLHAVSAANIYIIGNTAYKNATRSDAQGVYPNISFAYYSPNCRVVNNIIYAENGKICTDGYGGEGNTNSFYSDNVYFNGTHEPLQYGNADVDPKLAGPFNDLTYWIKESFKIGKDSPAYNKGITGDWGDYPDMWQTARPQNGKYEIGAYEFPEAANNSELLVNKGFEENLSVGWTQDWSNTNVNNSIKKNGIYSLKVGPGRGGRAQKITREFEIGKIYTLSAMMLVNDVNANINIGVKCNFAQGEPQYFGTDYLTVANSWENVTRTFAVPANTISMDVYTWSDGGANYTAYIDDFSLVATSPAAISSKNSEINDNFKVDVYPNPVTSNLNLTYNLKMEGNVTFQLHNSYGNQIKQFASKAKVAGEQTFIMDVSDLKSGIYFIKITTSEGEQVIKKIMVNNN